MTAIPVRKRDFRAFLSHSSQDKPIISEIYQWLTAAGISIWYDEDMVAGINFVNVLEDAIPLCQSMIIVISEDSLVSDWVNEEYTFALDHQKKFPEFKVIPILLDGSKRPGFLLTRNYIQLTDGKLNFDFYYHVLRAMYSGDIALTHGNQKDIYVSYGWRDNEVDFTEGVFRRFIQERFRLIGDYKDHPGFFDRSERIKNIISSCGGLLAVAPYRDAEVEHGFTSKYIWQEIKLAQEYDLPCVLICENGVEIPPQIEAIVDYTAHISRDTNFRTLPELTSAVGVINHRWPEHLNEHYIFFATGFEHKVRNDCIIKAIERITGMRCFVGEKIRGDQQSSVQSKITDLINDAYFCIGDISQGNSNTLIEMGIARSANIRYRLIASAPRSRPPFMFRDKEVEHFSSDAELLCIIHRLIYPYRRFIINDELNV